MDRPNLIQSLKDNAKKLLYIGSKFTKLSAVLRLYNLKVRNGWSNKNFTALLNFLKDMLPKANEHSNRTYDIKKILCYMSMNYERVHACLNDCILYRKDYEDLERCSICEVDRYKKNKNKIPAKVIRYFSVISRFKHIFRNAQHAKILMWH